MTAMTPDLEAPNPPSEVPGVLGRLETTRLEIKRSRGWTSFVTFFLVALFIVLTFLLADWMWVLPLFIRAVVVPALIGLAVFILLRAWRPFDRGAAAVEVEACFPALGQRVRTLDQFHGPAAQSASASPSLLRELGRDTDRRTDGLDFRKLVPWTVFERRALGLLFAVLASLGALVAVPSLRTAALRMMFLPAHYTTIKVEPGDLTLKAGEELKLKVTLSGRPVSAARWLYRETQSGGEWTSASLAPGRAEGKPAKRLSGTLTTSLKDLQKELDYRVVAGEIQSPVYHVSIVYPLLLKDLEAKVTPPSYTRRKPEVVKQGNLQVIEGSSVDVQVALSHAPRSAELVVQAPGQAPVQVPLLNLGDARLTGRLPALSRDVEYHIKAVDEAGMKLEIDPFKIKVTLDQKPTLRFVQPDDALAVTPTTEVPVEVEAGDDFGVSRVGIAYKVGNGPEETLELADYKDQPVTAGVLAMLYLEKHAIAYPDEISYYAFVLDNYPAEPHRVVSELRFIDILPYRHEYQFVDAQGEPASGGSLTLEELIARQRVNLSRTFVLERDRTVNEKAAMRLATFEEELASATTEFADGLKARGLNIPALDDASSAMRAATNELDERNLSPARSHEESALKSLISVRQNLRKQLSLNPGQMASAARAFDRQQAQKIRRPPQDKKEQLEADLLELAKREQEFSEEIDSKGSGGVQVEPPPANQQQAETPEESSADSSPSAAANSSASTSATNSSKSTDPKDEQQKAAAEAERLRQMAHKDKALTELAKERLDAAAKLVQESSRAMEAGQKDEAAEKAREAARKLESAARQVGALKAKELADALARQRDIAQAIAKAERELGKSLESEARSQAGAAGAESRPAESKQGEPGGKSDAAESKQGEPGGPSGRAEGTQSGSTGRKAAGQSKASEGGSRSGPAGSRRALEGGRSALAGRQRELADEVAALGDVLDRLQSEAALDYRELAQTIDRAARQNPPAEIEGSMRRNVAAIESKQTAQAAREAEQTAARLEALAQDLEAVRRAAVQPQLERLLAAERQAAQVQERLHSLERPSDLAQAERGMAELAGLVDKIAPGAGALRQAGDSLASAIGGAQTGVSNRVDRAVDPASGYFVSPVAYTSSVAAVIVALQSKIQEMILDSALAERDGPVPPRYKEMVDDYYRVLSQDLR